MRSYTKGFNRGALPGEKFEEFGRDLEESRQVAKMLEEAGYDMLNCDNGTYDAWYWPHPPVYMPKACNLDDVAEIKKVVNIPVICAGKFDDPVLADEAIASGKIDMMGMGRPLLADPDLANKFKEGKEDDIRPCIGCHLGCLSRIFQPPFKDISCALNPRCGLEKQYALQEATHKKNIAVVGGGIGGMEAARVLAIRGHKVTLFEKESVLGGVFIAASAFTFKEDDKRLLAWYRKQINDLPIDVRLNTLFAPEMAKDYDEIIVSIDAKERQLDTPGFDDAAVSYAIDTLLNKKIENKNVVIIGGGLTGIEIAYQSALNGCHVTVVETMDQILNVENMNAANYNMLMDIIDYYHIDVIKNAVVTQYKDGMATVEITSTNVPNINGRAASISLPGVRKTIKEIPADHIIVSVGYTSNRELYNTIKGEHVYLLGDAKKPANLMSAIWDAYEIAMKL